MFRQEIQRELRARNGHKKPDPLNFAVPPGQAEQPARTPAASRARTGDDNLIADIYRAASGLCAWPAVLEKLNSSLGGTFLQLIGIHKSSGKLAFSLHSEGGPRESGRACSNMHHAIDPATAELDRLPLAVVLNNRHLDDAALLGVPWYRDCWIPDDGRHVLASKFFDNGRVVAVIQVIRASSQQVFSGQHERRLARLMVHLASAIEVLCRQHRLQTGTAVAELLLLRSRQPSFLLGEGGWILFSNTAAKRLLDARTLLVERAGYLGARSAESDAGLKMALNQPGVNPAVLALHDTARGRAVPGCLWLLASQNATSPFGPEATSLLILAAATNHAAPDPLVLGAIFGFTPGEARVASHLLQGRPPKAIATALGLAVPTVRHHIRKLLAKAGVRDLRELACALTLAMEVGSL